MSEQLVNKWLKRDEKYQEKDKARKEEKKKDVIQGLERMIRENFDKSLESGVKALAGIHHSLFTEAISGNELASTALFHIRNNLYNLVLKDKKLDLGVFLIKYSKNWFRLHLILEYRAQEFISWVANRKSYDIDFIKVLKNLNKSLNIDYSIIDTNYKMYSTLKLELSNIAEQLSIEAAKRLRNLIHNTMRLNLVDDDYKIKLQYIAFFIRTLSDDPIAIQEVIHELAKDWFRSSLELKRWFHLFIEKINQHPDLETYMYKGYNWAKFANTSKIQRSLEKFYQKKEKSKEINNETT